MSILLLIKLVIYKFVILPIQFSVSEIKTQKYSISKYYEDLIFDNRLIVNLYKCYAACQELLELVHTHTEQ